MLQNDPSECNGLQAGGIFDKSSDLANSTKLSTNLLKDPWNLDFCLSKARKSLKMTFFSNLEHFAFSRMKGEKFECFLIFFDTVYYIDNVSLPFIWMHHKCES